MQAINSFITAARHIQRRMIVQLKESAQKDKLTAGLSKPESCLVLIPFVKAACGYYTSAIQDNR